MEIGPGPHSHYKYIKHPFKKFYILETNKEIFKKYKKHKKIIAKFQKSNKLPFKINYFDRIIMSHVLEHISEPEIFLFNLLTKLKKGGNLSISLPTDPGFLWRLGRFYQKLFNVKNKLNLNNREYDYMIATEHVNSIFNLVSILRYHFKNNISINSYSMRR